MLNASIQIEVDTGNDKAVLYYVIIPSVVYCKRLLHSGCYKLENG